MELKKRDLIQILTNPFYCLSRVKEVFTIKHNPLITEEQFIKVGIKLIEEIGPEEYLKNLLKNLRENNEKTNPKKHKKRN